MAFYATCFIFDNIPSEEYGLIISSSDGESSNDASHNVELITDEIYRRHTPYFYGVKQSQMLAIPGSIRSINGEITQEDASYIQTWLFGQMTFKELRIVQPDMEGYYFKCFLLDPEIIRVGNIIVGFDFTIQLDSPFAYGEEEEITIEVNEDAPSAETILYTFLNKSNNNYYTFPIIETEVSGIEYAENSYLQIVNTSDNNRIFQLGTDTELGKLNLNEYIIIDNNIQSFVSYQSSTPPLVETVVRRLDVLQNYYFFRLVPGANILSITSANIKYIKVRYTPLRRMS